LLLVEQIVAGETPNGIMNSSPEDIGNLRDAAAELVAYFKKSQALSQIFATPAFLSL